MGETLNARRWAGLSGIASAVLFSAGSATWALGSGWPRAGAPAAEIVAFYADVTDRIIIGASLSALAIGIFVLFAAALRQVLIEAGAEEFLATTAFGGALLGMAAGLSAELINMVGAHRARDGELSEGLAESLHEISQIFGSTAAGLGLGTFALATSAAAIRSGALPRWAAIFTGLTGIVLLTPLSRIGEVAGAGMVAIGVIIGIVLLRTPGTER